jgi:hypothetical protein
VKTRQPKTTTNVMNSVRPRSIHGVRFCNECRTTWNRDVNAARCIRYRVVYALSMLIHQRRSGLRRGRNVILRPRAFHRASVTRLRQRVRSRAATTRPATTTGKGTRTTTRLATATSGSACLSRLTTQVQRRTTTKTIGCQGQDHQQP